MTKEQAAHTLWRAAGHVGKACGWAWSTGSPDSVAYCTLMAAMYSVLGESIQAYPDSLIGKTL